MDRIEGPTTPSYLDSLATSVEFRSWQGRIQTAVDADDLMRVMRAYLAVWTPEQLRHIPFDLASVAIPDAEALISRAVMTSRAELLYKGTEVEAWLLRQMALTLSAAATRLRFIHGFRDFL